MVVLALDTTTREGSIAVVRDGVLLDTFTGDASVTHGERLPRDLVRVLERSALELGNVDVFAVAAGPGSFTGLRIGIAAMQGLALATGQSLVGVSALDAIHDAVRSRSPQSFAVGAVSQVVAWMDAQRGQVFSAVYRESGLIEGPVVDLPEPILARWCSARGNEDERLFAGDGAMLYRDAIRRARPDARIVEAVPPLAPSIARLAEAQVREHGVIPPDTIRPIYIRRADAELARDRRA